MFVHHIPFLHPSYTDKVGMGIDVNVQEEGDWAENSIAWVKYFFGKDFQDHCYDHYVSFVVMQLKTINMNNMQVLPEFDPNTINNLEDVCNFIKGSIMKDLYQTDRDKCFNILFRLYRRFGQSINQWITEDAVISYFNKNGITNIQLGEITYSRGTGSLRKHSLITLAIISNNSLLQRLKDCEVAAFGCYLFMDRRVTPENSDKWRCKYDYVKIDRALAPRDRVEKNKGFALYYLLYDKMPRLTYAEEEKHLIQRIVKAATEEGETLEELISKVSNEYNKGMAKLICVSFFDT